MARPQPNSLLQRIEAMPIIIVFVLLLALFMYLAPEVFLRPYQYTTFLSTLPPIILLAIGLTFIIGAGEIDLCFPAIIGFSGFTFASIFQAGQPTLVGMFSLPDTSWWASPAANVVIQIVAVIASLAAGVVIGFINGFLVARIGIPSFIATLAPSSSGTAWPRCSPAAAPMRCAAPIRARSGKCSSGARSRGRRSTG
jgi:simple sugar transport system permease protein